MLKFRYVSYSTCAAVALAWYRHSGQQAHGVPQRRSRRQLRVGGAAFCAARLIAGLERRRQTGVEPRDGRRASRRAMITCGRSRVRVLESAALQRLRQRTGGRTARAISAHIGGRGPIKHGGAQQRAQPIIHKTNRQMCTLPHPTYKTSAPSRHNLQHPP
eukprot:IDg12211t1